MKFTRFVTLKLLAVAVCMHLLESCSPKYVGYVTSTQNIPLLSERNQGQIMGAIGLNHAEGQASFSPIKHIALMGNLYGGVNGGSSELGGGLYTSTKSGFVFEAYALYINADMSRESTRVYRFLSEHVDAEVKSLKAQYDGYSGQFDIGYKIPSVDMGNASIGIGVKYSQVNYDKFDYKRSYYTHWEEGDQRMTDHLQINLPQSKVTFVSISPTAHIGFGPVQLFLQFSTHISLNNFKPGQNSFPLYSKNWLTAGFEIRLNEGSLKRREERELQEEQKHL